MKFLFATLLILSSLAAFAQDLVCKTIQETKAKVYGFHPPQLTNTQRNEKATQMDEFWKLVKSSGGTGTVCLRELLAAEKQDHFFQFDGSSLLFSLDKSDASMKVILPAVEQSSLSDVELGGYLGFVLKLSQNGADVGPLADKFLKLPKANTFIPQHSLQLDRDTAAIFLYGSMPPAQADKYLLEDLNSDTPYVRSAAAHLLSLQMTEESFKALQDFDTTTIAERMRRKDIDSVTHYDAVPVSDAPKFSREQVLKIIHDMPQTKEQMREALQREGKELEQFSGRGNPEAMMKYEQESAPVLEITDHTAFLKSAVATLTEGDLDAVREARRKCLHGISDESLDEYFSYTQIILGLINRLDLYPDYRIHPPANH